MHKLSLVVILGLGACGGAESPAAAVDAGSDVATDSVADTGGSSVRSLTTCTTNVAADAPAFYRTYFKCVTIVTTPTGVAISTEGLPPHLSYYYGKGNPNYAEFDVSRGASYHPNPNVLAKQSLRFEVPNAPTPKGGSISPTLVDGVVGTSTAEYPMGPAGVAIDSVVLFNPMARPGDDIAAERFTFDSYDAHPAPDLAYHYHTASPGPLEVLVSIGQATKSTPGAAEVELYGVMCDGTFVLGCTELDGSAPTGTLDAQGGHLGDLKDRAGTAHFTGRYHVHVCPSSATGRKYTPEIQYYTTCGR